MRSAASASTGAGCLAAFGALFAVVGIAVVVAGTRGQLRGEGNAWVGMYVGGAFAVFGAAMVLAAWWGGRQVKEQRALAGRFPGQPWRWRADWATGEVRDETGMSAMAMGAFAIAWNVIALPAGVLGVRAAIVEANRAAWLAMLFPIVGIGLVVQAMLLTARRRKFGVSVLRPSRLPASPGRALTGTVHVPSRFDGVSSAVSLRLFCINRRVVGTGKHRRTVETVLWEEEREVKPTLARGSGGGLDVPIRFQLPRDVPLTRNGDGRDRDLWYLDARASLPGADYAARFEVPVFVDEHAPVTADEAEAATVQADRPRTSGPTERGVTATRRIDGGWDFAFAAARNKGGIVVLVVLFLVFAGVAGALLVAAPQGRSLGVPFALAAMGIAYGAWRMTFARSAITVSRGTLQMRSSSPFHDRTRQLQATEIAEVGHRIAYQFGHKPYYALWARTTAGKQLTLASGLVSKRDAEWIVETIRTSLGQA